MINQSGDDDFSDLPIVPISDLPTISIDEVTRKRVLIQSMTSMTGDHAIVKLLDGTYTKITWPMKSTRPPAYTPGYLREWIERPGQKWPRRVLDFMLLLIDDGRMAEFWDWLARTEFSNTPMFKNAHTVADAIRRATYLPGKPGDMTPKQRDLYFEQVRKHASALLELLSGTKFDQEDMREISDDELELPLSVALKSYGVDEDEDGHIKAFAVTPGGRYEMPYDFPGSHLTQTLHDLSAWTYWDDHWDGGIYNSSKPIAQANSDSARIVYFSCSVHTWFVGRGVEIPFPILATLANVALKLEVCDQVDEDTVRKQVRRYQKRQAKTVPERAREFEDAGQNFDDSGNSVLSDPI